MEEKNNKQNENTFWGVSTSHLLDKNDFDSLLYYEPDVIEFYNYKDIDSIAEFCQRNKIKPALHVPTPCDQPSFTRFCPTASGSPEDIEDAIRMTKATISCAAEIGALHVVVHFPTPIPPYAPVTEEETDFFFKDLCSYAEKLNVTLLVENLTPHPFFHTPDDYAQLLLKYNVDFCLDVGHAHLLEPKLGVQSFIDTWKKNVKSVHLYNLTEKRYASFGHEPIELGQDKADGWIDMAKILNDIIQTSQPKSIILEYGPMNAADIEKSAKNWKQFKLKELP